MLSSTLLEALRDSVPPFWSDARAIPREPSPDPSRGALRMRIARPAYTITTQAGVQRNIHRYSFMPFI
jgi:hypothetical protein